MRTPAIVVNFKVYDTVAGTGALELARVCEQVSSESGASIVVSPPGFHLAAIAAAVKLPVFAQHVDPKPLGSVTGYLPPQDAAAVGAAGTLINHSEHKVPHQDVGQVLATCRELGLVTVACADDNEEATALAGFRPDFVAVEPPELIGGDISVTDASPDIVEAAVRAVRTVSPDVAVLCGAGVKTGKDVRKALELGTSGVLLASGVVKAKDPREALEDLVSGL